MKLRYVVNGSTVSRNEFTSTSDPARLADMLRDGRGPYLKTDDTFLASFKANGAQFEGRPQVGDRYRKLAAQKGLTSVTGKVYLSQLAKFPGDPRAWVSGRGDVQRVCEERGWSCDGAVKVAKPVYEEPYPEKTLDERIVREKVAERLEAEPHLAPKARELAEEVFEKHRPRWDKAPSVRDDVGTTPLVEKMLRRGEA